MNGLLVIDKPGGITSRGAVNRVQRWFPRRTRIGHTGTLDPLATGVLVLCVGSATKQAARIQNMGKTYRTRLRLGATSNTDDADGVVTPVLDAIAPDEARIRELLAAFVGRIEQVPPVFSALKLGGRRAHELARGGKTVILSARPVDIYAVQLLDFVWPFLDLDVECGKGTYIRSIARDLGATLGCGALVQTLRRTRVGPFTAEQGVGIDVSAEAGRSKLLPVSVLDSGDLFAPDRPAESAVKVV